LSAKGGFAEAQAKIAALTLRDYISDQSKMLEAFNYAEKSAEQGHGLGLAILARFYVEGLVVEEDLEKGLKLYKIAYYEKGFKKARISIEQIEMYKLKQKLPATFS
jgi:TPR repeat protein